MTILDIGLTAAFVLLMILVAGAGVLQALVATILVAYFVYPRILLGQVKDDGYFVGISWAHSVVLTCHVAIVFALAYAAIRGKGLRFESFWPVLPLVVFAALFFGIGWTPSRALTAGFVHLLTVAVSWAVGYVLFSAVHSRSDGERILSKWIAGVATFIALVCVLQAAGFDINSNSTKLIRSAAGARDTVAGMRVVSTFNEPTAAGKFLFLLGIIAAVWLFGRDVQKKWNAMLMVGATLVVALLTQTRSNFAALGVLLLLYSLAVNKRNLFARVALMGIAAALVIFASFSTWDARFSEGSGIRGHTLDVAFDFIANNPDILWTGIGPNRYFEVLAPLDSWVAQGYPAHNYFIYLIIELGILGTLCYILPFVVLTVRAVVTVRNRSRRPELAKAWLCSLPGLLLVAMLGWGLLSAVAPALFVIMGYVYASLVESRHDDFQLDTALPTSAGDKRKPITGPRPAGPPRAISRHAH